MRTSDLQKHINSLWTSDDVCAYFGVTPMTVYLWRQNRGLPALVFPGNARNAVRFVPDEVRAWAAKMGIKIARESLAVA